MCTVLLPPGVNTIAVIKYIISYYKIRGKTLNIPVYVIEAYGTAELQLHSFFILAQENSGQLHTPVALLPGISASILNQQEAEGTLSQSGGVGGLEERKIA